MQEVREWRPGRVIVWLAGVQVVAGMLQVVGAVVGDLEGLLLAGLVVLSSSLLLILIHLPRLVTARDDGLVVRGPFWRTRFVRWSDVADIRSYREVPGSPLAVFLTDGSVVRTDLHPVEHRSLPRYWRSLQDRQAQDDAAAPGGGRPAARTLSATRTDLP